jgi:hypothetical protein
MSDVVTFEILVPLTDNSTGIGHAPHKFRSWVDSTVRQFGGITTLGLAVQGLWYDQSLPARENPIQDHSNWYKIGVAPSRVGELRAFIQETARTFGQKCIYFERAGDAEFVWHPELRPPEASRGG